MSLCVTLNCKHLIEMINSIIVAFIERYFYILTFKKIYTILPYYNVFRISFNSFSNTLFEPITRKIKTFSKYSTIQLNFLNDLSRSAGARGREGIFH